MSSRIPRIAGFLFLLPTLAFSAVLLEDPFETGGGKWRAEGGDWRVNGNQVVSTSGGKYLAGSARWKDYTVRVRLATEEPGKDTWNTAMLYFRRSDEVNHYAVLLHTDGRLELVRTRDGQRQPSFAKADAGAPAGKWHELAVTVQASRITISVDGKKQVEITDADPILRGGIALGNNNAKRCAFEGVSVTAPEGPEAKLDPERSRTVAVFRKPGVDTAPLEKALEQAGMRVRGLGPEEAAIDGVLDTDSFFLYIIPDSGAYPAEGVPALTAWLGIGGQLITLGAPAFGNMLYRLETKEGVRWNDRAGMASHISQTRAKQILINGEQDISWTLSTDDKACGAEMRREDGASKGKCFAYEVKKLGGWATFYSALEGGLPADAGVLCLSAKADAATPGLLVELVENDGSRWIYPLLVGNAWSNYVIPLDQIPFWHDSPTRGKRGNPGDSVRPKEVKRINFGLARGNLSLQGNAFRFWVDEIGSAPHPLPPALRRQFSMAPPIIEALSPAYKVYPLSNVRALEAVGPLSIQGAPFAGSLPQDLYSCYPRPRGEGFSGQNRWRWIPLVRALDAQGRERGIPASLLIHTGGEQSGAVSAMIGAKDPEPAWVAALARRMKSGVFLLEAGSDAFSYAPGENAQLGARIQNASGKSAKLAVKFMVQADGKPLFAKEITAQVPAGALQAVRVPWNPSAQSARFAVRTELFMDGKLVDLITHDGGMLKPAGAPVDASEFVTAKDGDFWCGGKKWYPNGMNYWPRDAAALEPGAYNEGWLTPGAYSPAMIESDLAQMKGLGINLVSIQMGRTNCSRNLRDFMRRCAAFAIKVNGFVDGANPTDPMEGLAEAIIREGRLADEPGLFAYDISWEAGNHVFNGRTRKRWDKDWNAWVRERYGSAENARADWRHPGLETGEDIRSPLDKELTEDGEWRTYVAAYRRFMDDHTSRLWNAAHRRLRLVDGRHLISFRQGNTLPYDFGLTGPVKHVDFIEPEGYSIKHDDDGYDASGFITRYVNFTTAGKPIYWAEFGRSVWNGARMAPDPAQVGEQGAYHEKFYRMCVEAGANGLSPWWWPGGYRVNEKSDFGVLEPDGAPRPSALCIKAWADRITNERKWPAADAWLEVDRDAHAGGYWHLTFNAGKDAYRDARSKGKNLGVKTVGTGSDSANTPLTAVGNTPYNGKNPPKFLNGEFNRISIQSAAGEWVDLFRDGGAVTVAKGKPVRVKASMGNLGEARWLAPAKAPGKGSVHLSSREGEIRFRAPILQDVPTLQDGETGEFILTPGIAKESRVVFELTALDRAWFGNKWTVILRVD